MISAGKLSGGLGTGGCLFCAENNYFHLPLVLNVRLSPLFHTANDKKLCWDLGLRLLETHVFPEMI